MYLDRKLTFRGEKVRLISINNVETCINLGNERFAAKNGDYFSLRILEKKYH